MADPKDWNVGPDTVKGLSDAEIERLERRVKGVQGRGSSPAAKGIEADKKKVLAAIAAERGVRNQAKTAQKVQPGSAQDRAVTGYGSKFNLPVGNQRTPPAPLSFKDLDIAKGLRGGGFGINQDAIKAYRERDRVASDANRERFSFGDDIEDFITDQGAINTKYADQKLGLRGSWGTSVDSRAQSKGDLRWLEGMTPADAIKWLRGLTKGELMKVQSQMDDMGMYEQIPGQSANNVTTPTFGLLDEGTYRAFTYFMRASMAHPDATLNEVIAGEKLRTANERRGLADKNASSDTTAAERQRQKALIAVPNAESLMEAVDTAAQTLLGHNLSDDAKATITAGIQARFKALEEEKIDFQYKPTPTEPGTPGYQDDEADAFIGALIGKESGGQADIYNTSGSGAWGLGQIMPDNWVNWSVEAGLDPADRSAANQMKVIKNKVLDYKRRYGSWYNVAIAWYAGPGAIGGAGHDAKNYTNGDEYDSINEYASSLVARMKTMPGGSAATTGGYDTLVQEDFDQGAEITAGVKAADPLGYETNKWAKQAKTFFDLLGSPRSGRTSAVY